MTATTPNLHLPYPEDNDTVDVPRDVKALALAVDAVAGRIGIGPLADRPATPIPGTGYYATDTGVRYLYVGNSVWLTDGIQPGFVQPSALPTVPAGFLPCDGRAVTSAFAVLRTALTAAGNPYGVDGVDPKVPDYRGRGLVGTGAGPGLTTRALGESGGEETHLNTGAESGMPAHNHGSQLISRGGPGAGSILMLSEGVFILGANTHGNQGVNQNFAAGPLNAAARHNNMQPWAGVLWLIKT